MDKEIKPIETTYNGYRFRSRVEARWAVFFDTLGIPYEYEKEGYDLGGVWYLPDFWLPQQDCWVEIKGQEPNEQEMRKAEKLAYATKKHVFLFWGTPGLYSWEPLTFEDDLLDIVEHGSSGHAFFFREQTQDVYFGHSLYWFGECKKCCTLIIARFGEWVEDDEIDSPELLSTKNVCHCDYDDEISIYSDQSPRLIAAYTAARQARFEYGETPQAPEYSNEELTIAKGASEAAITGPGSPSLEAICDADRQYFEVHPDKALLIRPFYEEEVRPEVLTQWKKNFGHSPYYVEVHKTKTPGVRSRTFMASADGKSTCGMVWDADTPEAMQVLEKGGRKLQTRGQQVHANHKAKQARKQANQQRKKNRRRK